jgi:hypothetical protein
MLFEWLRLADTTYPLALTHWKEKEMGKPDGKHPSTVKSGKDRNAAEKKAEQGAKIKKALEKDFRDMMKKANK